MAQNNNGPIPIFFNDVQSGLRTDELVFRLIHFWEARNPNKGGLLIGLELLFIDEHGPVIQGFIAANRIARYQRLLYRNAIYRLTNYFATKNKLMFSVTEHEFILCFTDLTTLIQVRDTDFFIDVQRFRFRSYSEFDTQADMRGPLYANLSLSSMSSSRIFFDTDLDLTKEYLTWLGDNASNLVTVNTSKIASFICEATIANVICESGWYRLQLLVHDSNNESTFVLFDDAATSLVGMSATKLMDTLVQENEATGAADEAAVPQRLFEFIGQTHKFEVKVTEYNFRAKRQTISVTKILEPATLPQPISQNLTLDKAEDNHGQDFEVVERGDNNSSVAMTRPSGGMLKPSVSQNPKNKKPTTLETISAESNVDNDDDAAGIKLKRPRRNP